MKIVIDIPEDVYTRLFDNGIQDNEIAVDDVCEMARALRLGTPLPKGHGRLGDLDALETEMVNGIKAGNYEEGYETFAHINDIDDCVECVKYADTIIEADKGGDMELKFDKRFIDEAVQEAVEDIKQNFIAKSEVIEWLNSFDTSSATKCFEAVNLLKQRLGGEDGR